MFTHVMNRRRASRPLVYGVTAISAALAFGASIGCSAEVETLEPTAEDTASQSEIAALASASPDARNAATLDAYGRDIVTANSWLQTLSQKSRITHADYAKAAASALKVVQGSPKARALVAAAADELSTPEKIASVQGVLDDLVRQKQLSPDFVEFVRQAGGITVVLQKGLEEMGTLEQRLPVQIKGFEGKVAHFRFSLVPEAHAGKGIGANIGCFTLAAVAIVGTAAGGPAVGVGALVMLSGLGCWSP
jgi:hypothetical protein